MGIGSWNWLTLVQACVVLDFAAAAAATAETAIPAHVLAHSW
jgi:hypothetical protein